MNKYLLIAAMLFAACGNSGNTSSEREEEKTPERHYEPEVVEDSKIPEELEIGDVEFRITEITGREFRDLPKPSRWGSWKDKEEGNIAPDKDAVKRIGDSLIFTTAENEQIILVNASNDDESDGSVTYRYEKYLPTAYQFVVTSYYYEGWDCMLVDRRNGDKHDIPGHPYVSPDGKYLISTNSDLEVGFNMNGVALFEIKEDRIESVDQEEVQTWGPGEVRWIDDKSLAMEIDVWKNNKLAKKYIRLTMKD